MLSFTRRMIRCGARRAALPVLVGATLGAALGAALGGSASADPRVVEVGDDAALRAALSSPAAGTTVRIAPGEYRGGVYVSGLRGTADAPIVIEGADPERPPVFVGGAEALHLSDCCHVVLRRLGARGQSSNGINIDDGGTFDTPAHHITIEDVQISDIGPEGNHDAIKLSGVEDFVVRGCRFEGWGGQTPDMVGCHRGLIERCTFRSKAGHSQHAGPQAKGGSSDIAIRACLFLDAASRGVQLGGSTDPQVFRPQGAKHEAKNLTVEGCTFVGCQAPVAFVGVDGAVVRFCTFYRPGKWVMRILQETTLPGFVACRNGRFEDNLIVFRRAEVSTEVNIGPNTAPETFRFERNWWYCEDRPERSQPALPVAETGGVYGIDPRLTAPERLDFTPQLSDAARFGAGAWKAR